MQAIVNQAQQPLRASYQATPELATVTDHARTCGQSASDPFHTRVEPMVGCGVVVPIGTHAALGGPHDAPTPGDMLCAALAACQDSSFCMVANVLGAGSSRALLCGSANAESATQGQDRHGPNRRVATQHYRLALKPPVIARHVSNDSHESNDSIYNSPP